MIRHIFKIIWNERKTNSWIILEYILVFCILWFCCDYLFFIGKSYYEPLGFDINNTYSVEMKQGNSKDSPGIDINKLSGDDRYSYAFTLMERLKQYPGVENVCISEASMPYYGGSMTVASHINNDSISQNIRVRNVSTEFFDVFKIKLTRGSVFDWTDPASEKHVLISPDRNGFFGDKKKSAYPISEVKMIDRRIDGVNPYTITGVTEKIKSAFFEPYEHTIFVSMEKWRVNPHSHIVIRIHPNAAKGFEERFRKEMKDQLNIGPYAFLNISSLKDLQKQYTKSSGITNNLNSVYSIGLFLIINIFLGLIGTFWYRTESRKSEIGLRIALGSSKRKIKQFLYTETIFLLLISAFIGINICINIGQTDFLSALGIPKANYEQIGAGIEQYFIIFGLTFLFLAFVSLLAVWYPARQSSNMQPAESLHEE